MANYADWLKVDPTSGNGDGSVSVSSVEPNTGRNARSTNISFTAEGCNDVDRKVSQAGKPEFVAFDSETIAVSKDGETINITGTSNSSKLTFSLGSGDINITLPETYVAAGKETANGAEIEDDPGATGQYAFNVSIDVPANTTTGEEHRQVVVNDNAGNSAVITIDETAGDPYLRVVDPEGDTINLDWEGSVVAVEIESNTNWEIV